MIIIEDVVRALGGKNTLQADIQKDSEMDQLIRAGIPYAACVYFREKLKMSSLQMGSFTGFKRRSKKTSDARLSPIASDRLYRLARLYVFTLKVLEDENGAAEWLKRPQWGLGGITPVEMAITEIGAKEVENLLGRIEHTVLP